MRAIAVAFFLVLASCGTKIEKREYVSERDPIPSSSEAFTERGLECLQECADKKASQRTKVNQWDLAQLDRTCRLTCLETHGGRFGEAVPACMRTATEEPCDNVETARENLTVVTVVKEIGAAYEPIHGEGNACKSQCLQLNVARRFDECLGSCAKFHGGKYAAPIPECRSVQCGKYETAKTWSCTEEQCLPPLMLVEQREWKEFPTPKATPTAE